MKNFVYTGAETNEISFPLGGIGTGSIGLAGNGRLLDWEIFNRPNKGSDNGWSHIAVKAERGGKLIDARILNGDVNAGFTGQYGKGYGHGLANSTMAGFPHFEKSAFKGPFPIAEMNFSDAKFPANVSLTAFNPFIPLNDKDSGIPAAFFHIHLENNTDSDIDYSVAMTVRNPFGSCRNDFVKLGTSSAIKFTQTGLSADDPGYGDLTLAADTSGAKSVSCQQYWYRGGWSDSLETYWRNFTEQSELKNRTYESVGGWEHATLCVKLAAKAFQTADVKFVLSWNMPNNVNYWNPYEVDGKNLTWKNYYATMFADSSASAAYAIENWDRLFHDTAVFREALSSMTMPEPVIDAVSSTMSVIKTATVLRFEDGTFYGWEGMNQNHGSCEGTCTHVWNYAYAMPFLFPALERTIRDSDFKYNRDENGRMQFRMQLPLGSRQGGWRACVDGQMGGVIKAYREWKISGDSEWLKKNWAGIKASLEYAWHENNFDGWDRDKDGVLEGRQHHTLDMELFGPSSWLEGFYLAALKAGAEMASYLGETESAAEYMRLFESGKKWSDENLFNGEYFIQKIDLNDKSILEKYTEHGSAVDTYWNDEAGEIKYQIGDGSEIDQLCAQWHANIVGLGEIFDNANVKTALKNMYKNNFKSSMRDFYNPFRIYCVNGESGAVICDYPDGAKKPAIPIPYCQECMHGFEYQLGALMVSEGMIDEGLAIVKSVRGRYNGENRNPWNEIECGNNYARSMASFSLIPILSGFKFDMVKGEIEFAPIINKENFKSIWSLDSGWGTFEINGKSAKITVKQGSLTVNSIKLPHATMNKQTTINAGETLEI
jgi:Predicted bile acid beta-glucosidase